MFGRLIIDTGKDEQQLINANPISRAVLLKKLVLPVIRELKRFNFLMADKTVKCLHCTSRTSFFRSRAGTL